MIVISVISLTMMLRILTALVIISSTGAIDYWDEDFDENKNCAREMEMKELQRETEPQRSASAFG